MNKIIGLSFLFVCAGCATPSETVHLRMGDSVVQCGPYDGYGGTEIAINEKRVRDCVNDYMRQGYQRVPSN